MLYRGQVFVKYSVFLLLMKASDVACVDGEGGDSRRSGGRREATLPLLVAHLTHSRNVING